MTTSRQKRIQSELEGKAPISEGTLAYLESRTMNDWYDFIVSKFLEEEAAGRLTRAELARRIHKSPAVITRLLSSPSNLTLATVSNLLVGIAGEETIPQSQKILGQPRSNQYPDWSTKLDERVSQESGSGVFDTQLNELSGSGLKKYLFATNGNSTGQRPPSSDATGLTQGALQ